MQSLKTYHGWVEFQNRAFVMLSGRYALNRLLPLVLAPMSSRRYRGASIIEYYTVLSRVSFFWRPTVLNVSIWPPCTRIWHYRRLVSTPRRAGYGERLRSQCRRYILLKTIQRSSRHISQRHVKKLSLKFRDLGVTNAEDQSTHATWPLHWIIVAWSNRFFLRQYLRQSPVRIVQ